MFPRICRCCGGKISAEVVSSGNPNLCADCERWLEDESPREAATKLGDVPLNEPAADLEVSPQTKELAHTNTE